MMSLHDPHLRIVLLGHVAARAADGAVEELRAAGIDGEQMTKLCALSAIDLIDLAEMRDFPISVTFDIARLESALRRVSYVKRAKSLELYFVRNGASSRMMRTLFRMESKVARRRRRELGAWRPPGRPRLPARALRERILHVWFSVKETDPRIRYYVLHLSFPDLPIAVLEAVIGSEVGGI